MLNSLVRWMLILVGEKMFRKLFGGWSHTTQKAGGGRSEAIAALQALDHAITTIHPDKYFDPHDAACELQPYLVNINTLLGRSEAERFNPVEYNAIVERMTFFAERGMLGTVVKASEPLPVIHALILGILHEVRIRHNKDLHDGINLGREVGTSTQTLIEFLNRASSTQ